jgi:hypothetical protein
MIFSSSCHFIWHIITYPKHVPLVNVLIIIRQMKAGLFNRLLLIQSSSAIDHNDESHDLTRPILAIHFGEIIL